MSNQPQQLNNGAKGNQSDPHASAGLPSQVTGVAELLFIANKPAQPVSQRLEAIASLGDYIVSPTPDGRLTPQQLEQSKLALSGLSQLIFKEAGGDQTSQIGQRAGVVMASSQKGRVLLRRMFENPIHSDSSRADSVQNSDQRVQMEGVRRIVAHGLGVHPDYESVSFLCDQIEQGTGPLEAIEGLHAVAVNIHKLKEPQRSEAVRCITANLLSAELPENAYARAIEFFCRHPLMLDGEVVVEDLMLASSNTLQCIADLSGRGFSLSNDICNAIADSLADKKAPTSFLRTFYSAARLLRPSDKVILQKATNLVRHERLGLGSMLATLLQPKEARERRDLRLAAALQVGFFGGDIGLREGKLLRILHQQEGLPRASSWAAVCLGQSHPESDKRIRDLQGSLAIAHSDDDRALVRGIEDVTGTDRNSWARFTADPSTC